MGWFIVSFEVTSFLGLIEYSAELGRNKRGLLARQSDTDVASGVGVDSITFVQDSGSGLRRENVCGRGLQKGVGDP